MAQVIDGQGSTLQLDFGNGGGIYTIEVETDKGGTIQAIERHCNYIAGSFRSIFIRYGQVGQYWSGAAFNKTMNYISGLVDNTNALIDKLKNIAPNINLMMNNYCTADENEGGTGFSPAYDSFYRVEPLSTGGGYEETRVYDSLKYKSEGVNWLKKDIEGSIQNICDCLDNLKTYGEKILEDWVGNASNAFETNYPTILSEVLAQAQLLQRVNGTISLADAAFTKAEEDNKLDDNGILFETELVPVKVDYTLTRTKSETSADGDRDKDTEEPPAVEPDTKKEYPEMESYSTANLTANEFVNDLLKMKPGNGATKDEWTTYREHLVTAFNTLDVGTNFTNDDINSARKKLEPEIENAIAAEKAAPKAAPNGSQSNNEGQNGLDKKILRDLQKAAGSGNMDEEIKQWMINNSSLGKAEMIEYLKTVCPSAWSDEQKTNWANTKYNECH